jgi:hypothetical protein
MSLPAGTRLNWYEIVGSIGAGGMGEVYRARAQAWPGLAAVMKLPHAGVISDYSWRIATSGSTLSARRAGT